jgi:hypothetical protein
VRYRLRFREDLSVDETICWSGFVPQRVIPESNGGLRFATITRDAGPDCLRIAIPLRDMAAALADDAQLSVVDAAKRCSARSTRGSSGPCRGPMGSAHDSRWKRRRASR